MMDGKIVRAKHWSGCLKYRIDSPDNGLLQSNFTKKNKQLENRQPIWETSNHHLGYEDFTDYEVLKNWN